METILDRLKNYFENTSEAQIKKDWDATEKYDDVNSPTVDEFLEELKSVADIPMSFIERSLKIGIKISKASLNNKTEYINKYSYYHNDLKNIYFAGQTLCLDVEDAIGTRDVLTLSWDSECFGYFSGGPRRLLSLKALRKLQELMDLNGINYEPKEILK